MYIVAGIFLEHRIAGSQNIFGFSIYINSKIVFPNHIDSFSKGFELPSVSTPLAKCWIGLDILLVITNNASLLFTFPMELYFSQFIRYL